VLESFLAAVSGCAAGCVAPAAPWDACDAESPDDPETPLGEAELLGGGSATTDAAPGAADVAVVGAVGVVAEVSDAGALGAAAAAAASEAGASIISTPMLLLEAPCVPEVGTASTGVDESDTEPLASASAGGKEAVTVKFGPAAPFFRTSVAETTLSGGVKVGMPERAARETSGLDLTIAIGKFSSDARTLWCDFA
jgi:hypothetical protein